MASRRSSGLATMLAGALVCPIHFMASYGAVTIICARGAAAMQWAGIGIVGWTIFALTAPAGLALAVIAWKGIRRDGFVDHVAAGVAGLAALAIAWEAWLVTRGPPCA